MNLLELMLKEEVEWPVGAEFAAQLGNMSIGFFYSNPEFHGEWCGTYETPSVSFKFLCDDWSTRIITREEYQSAGGIIANNAFEPFVSVEDAQECKAEHAATSKQSAPKGSGNPILGMVLADLTNRALEGKEKYGEPLKAHNGRSSVVDLLQELYDASMYCRQLIEELVSFGEDLESCISALAGTKCLEGGELAEHVSLLKSILRKNNALLAR